MNGPLGRLVFPSFVLAMWVTTGAWLAKGEWTGLNWLMLATAAVLTALIFVDFVSVFSFTYAFCMILIPAEILVVRGASTAGVLVAGMSILYGARLLFFIVQRRRSASYAPARAGERVTNSAVPTFLKVMLFVFITTLQTFQAMPPYLVADDGRTSTVLFVGVAVMVVGLLLETVADVQKYRAKERDSSTFVRDGLFARTRHPNYTGEILFQAGLAVSALGAVSGWWQVLAAVLAPGYIAVLMVFQSRNGDARMATRYADDPAWADYLASTRALVPGAGAGRVTSSR